MSIKETLVMRIVEAVVMTEGKVGNNSKEIDGETRFHHLFVAGVERFKTQLSELPYHELEAQAQAGKFSMFVN